jgi:hypothetical protein
MEEMDKGSLHPLLEHAADKDMSRLGFEPPTYCTLAKSYHDSFKILKNLAVDKFSSMLLLLF